MTPHASLSFAALSMLAASAFAQGTAPEASALDEPGRPRWEAGLVAGGGRLSDYPGSAQTHTRGIAVPLFIYRGPVLRVDQSGIRGRFVSSSNWDFDLSATAAFNAKNNDARQGMPALDYLFGVGPQWVYKGLQTPSGGPSLHLKFRALMSTNLRHVDQRGFSFDPELRWRLTPFGGSSTALTLSLQPTWATRSLHRYFYQVDASYATPTRPAYDAGGGYLGTSVGVGLTGRRSDSLSWFIGAHAMSLHGAANAGSPLLRDKSNFNIGAGIVWTPWHSADRVRD